MLQYLLNISCIWVLGLAVHFSLLRKESFHSFNRMYLIGLLAAGMVIPLITWQTPATLPASEGSITYSVPYTYAGQSSTIKQQIVAVVQPMSNAGIEHALWGIYFTGIFVMLLMLAKEVLKIIRLYKGSIKTKMQGCTLIETNEETAPFSIVGYIFISGRDYYDAQEYNLIVAHELRHIQLRHSIDLVLLFALHTIFWFHPLVYVIRKKLLQVHEYQADKIPGNTAGSYGMFLIEQSMLQSAPIISHSFSHLPLKNRIMMLTKKSARIARAKMLVVVPLAIVSILFFSNCNNQSISPDASIPEKKGTTATYKDNTIELETRRPDPDGSTWADRPLTLNGKTIHTIYSQAYHNDIDIDTEPEFSITGKNLGDYLFEELRADMEKLEDGRYNIIVANIVIDEKGNIAYYDYSGIQKVGTLKDGDDGFLRNNNLDNKIAILFDSAPAYKPATINGNAVPCSIFGLFGSGMSIDRHGTGILVQNHRASLYYPTQS